ncbi:hypothetical protein [Marinomonas transparens]|uniref:Lipoprotein n=1 Tax=Marinomonas transparens TaxID=2795388 RepID=A0A934JQD5_9GAMM|nr:hypothetical protein [Marinomonas transparens]MBJ7538139.1 hypothetical protein [Marinomonas transparens]
MNKLALQFTSASVFAFTLSGCSLFFTDHADDYQKAQAETTIIQAPQGSMPIEDSLVIPNEDVIDNLKEQKAFEVPRAPFVFYPMVHVPVTEQNNGLEFMVPANQKLAKRVVVDFLTGLHGAGTPIASQTETQITSVPFDFHPQGWWASLWSSITRVYPAETAFSFTFTEAGEATNILIQFRDEQAGEEPSDWLSPVESDDAYSVVARLWGSMGRQLNQASAYLSNRGEKSSFPVWINNHGVFAIHLGDRLSKSDFEAKLNGAGIYLMPNTENLLAPVPPEDVARVGDVIDFNIPTGNGQKTKLFNVRRRNLDDVSWEEREYSYKIVRQEAGDFLVIDVSSVDFPEAISFHLAQRFVN